MAGPKKKSKEPTKPKRGVGQPPKKEEDLPYTVKQLESLGGLNCTNDEIAAFYDISVDTYERDKKRWPWINDAVVRGRSKGKMSIRRQQVAEAMKGNVPMLIFLGKNYLGQSDKVDHDHDVKGEITHGVLVVQKQIDDATWEKQAIAHQRKIKEVN